MQKLLKLDETVHLLSIHATFLQENNARGCACVENTLRWDLTEIITL